MQNFGYLVAAYLILWLGLFGYLFWMSGVQRTLTAELSALRDALRLRGDSETPDALASHEAPIEPAELRER